MSGGEMHLSPNGVIVQEEWKKTPCIRPDVSLDAFVVMPNHIHGIIVIEKSFGETTGSVVSPLSETTHRVVSTGNKTKTLQPNSLGSIIGQSKSVCTKRIHASGYRDFDWQPRYYDHVIRNEKDLDRIREYITMNPSQWASDDEFAL